MALSRNYKSWGVALAVLALFAGVARLPAQAATAQETSLTSVVTSNNQFAVDLYRKLSADETGKNIFVSPFSISTALAMTYEGSAGNTRAQMAAVFHFNQSDAERQTGFADLMAATRPGPGKHYKLEVANALWGQKGYHFEASFLNATKKYYGGALENVDFAGNTEGARVEINTWVEDHTAQMIRDLIPKGAIQSDTPLVLTNAIYFKGDWVTPFKEAATQNEPFHVTNNQAVPVPMMHQTAHFSYVQEDGVEAIELPYADGDLSMIAILPDPEQGGDIDKLSATLTVDEIDKLRRDMDLQNVEVFFPRFNLEAGYSLGSTLAAMGMPDAFSEERADFSGMTGSPNLYIGKVIHKARIEVNEEGSVAAAATAVIMLPKSMPMSRPEVFRADRPFLFMIVHDTTGSILFMGKLSNPAIKPE
jgi:serpin B